eukprot:CAMPEP_0182852526 /NCGR_PEP_ID=MMETSP0034_2-20130328/209_1 /TAXON_ID=156128 /ORGANISM="Nephroselmis pyriformis, Strain CCMP717" /LENGTH=54 /DNA_ID=CAMNT_0024983239 /DNA_START=135 /DNA_END=300 /DNA_ORIENTATION=+
MSPSPGPPTPPLEAGAKPSSRPTLVAAAAFAAAAEGNGPARSSLTTRHHQPPIS